MLVLTRREGEQIVIGPLDHPIAVIEVVRVGQERVRLGITADRTIPVNRREILELQKKPEDEEENS